MDEEVLNKIDVICSYVCNGKTYKYEQKLKKAVGMELYDSAIIYSWKIFMLFVYEKIWNIRELEFQEEKSFTTDKIFLPDKKKEQHNFFEGNLFSLNKLSEHKQGDDFIISKLNSVFKGVDPQILKEAHQILKKRHTASHLNSIDLKKHDLIYVLEGLNNILQAVQDDYKKIIKGIFKYEEDYNIVWHHSRWDMKELDVLYKNAGHVF